MKWPLSSIAGIISVSIYCIFLIISFTYYPVYFSPLQNTLSDLGNYANNPGALYYNLGQILGGCLAIIFFVGLSGIFNKKMTDRRLLIIFQVTGVFASVFVIGTGIFTEDYGEIHLVWAILFFITLVLCSLIGGIFVVRQPESIKGIGAFSIFVTFLQTTFLLLMVPLRSFVLEWCIFITGDLNFILGCLNYAHVFKARNKA